MDCRTFDLLLEKPETEWTAEEKRQIEAHAAACADCATLLAMRREMRAIDESEQVPASFTASWQNAIRREEQKQMDNQKIRYFPWTRVIAAIAAVLVLCVGTTAAYLNDWGQGVPLAANREQTKATADDTGTYEEPAEYVEYEEYEEAADYDMEFTAQTNTTSAAKRASGAAAAPMTAASEATMDDAAADEGSARETKIIRTASLTIRTRQYESDCQRIRDLAASCGGRVESSSTSGDGSADSLRRGSLSLRIPSQELDAFMTAARAVGAVSDYSENAEDVSDSYYDIRSRLATQQTKMQRLKELMEKAASVSELIELENAISDTQYWIDAYTGQIKGYDSRVSESSVYVYMREINSAQAAETRSLSLGERVGNAVRASVQTAGRVAQAMVIFLVSALPWIAALAVLVLAIALIRRSRKHRK